MPIRTTRVHLNHLKPGLKVWVRNYCSDANRSSLFGMFEAKQITILGPDPKSDYAWLVKGLRYQKEIYPSDLGMPGAAYDNRVAQVFSTKAAMLKAMEYWGTRNPNFIDKDTGQDKRQSDLY